LKLRQRGDRVNAKQPYGPPMTLGNMRKLGVQRLIASQLTTH
jgi:hypothetical protein